MAADSLGCEWCGERGLLCLCDGCTVCGWYHDGGPPRKRPPLNSVLGPDGRVHYMQWERGIFAIPTCWEGMNHIDPYPRGFEFEKVLEVVNCLGCLGA